MSMTQSRALPGEIFDLPGGGRALFTTRAHGNMSSVGGAGCEDGLAKRERLREAVGVRVLVRGYQVHGTVVGRVLSDGHRTGSPNAFEEIDGEHQPTARADGHAVAARELGAMVLAADCMPVVLGAEDAVAALHAGWRGLAAGILEEGVRALHEVGGRGEIMASIGPCAGACCYEVGEEVHAVFGAVHRDGRSIDLRAIARKRLLAAGVAEVLDIDACTICDKRFFSHRREGARAGRQAAVAWLPS